MNLNTILAILGFSLLAFVAAFAIGRQRRPLPAFDSQTATSVVSSGPTQAQSVASNVSLARDESPADAAPEPRPAAVAPEAASAIETAVEEAAAAAPIRPTPAERASRKRAAENRVAIAARRAHADQIPDDFRKYYAQELPEDAISSEQNVQTSVAGEQAEVITLTSRAFNKENKDFVLQQVRSELEALGFKRVYITNGRGFKTTVSL